MEAAPIVIPPGRGHRVGNVEFLARTADTPRFTFGIIEIAAGRELEAHVHTDEDDGFYILEGEMTFIFTDRACVSACWDVRSRAARSRARVPQRADAAGANAQHPRPGRIRPAHRSGRLMSGS